MMARSSGQVAAFIDRMNSEYFRLHKNFEDCWWAAKMALKSADSEAFTRTRMEYNAFLRDKGNLAEVRRHMEGASEQHLSVLKIMERTFKCYLIESPEAAAFADGTLKAEAALMEYRDRMKLGYTDPTTGEFQRASSVQLRTKMMTSDDESVRKAALAGLRSIGPHVAEKLAEIVRRRTRLAKMLGYPDFYDYKVRMSEGMSKDRLFEILDDLEQRTRPLLEECRSRLAKEKGPAVLNPWNTGYMLAGESSKAMDPYFRFGDIVDAWARTMAALGVNYRGSTVQLDLCDRPGKFSNAYCHWPQPAYRKLDGTWVPAQTNFTTLATPSAVGSGRDALHSLLHEGGHAAHFANIDQHSPFFSQERPPMSVAYAENQSMFLDSFEGDAAWIGRYARDAENKPMPWALLEKNISDVHPYAVRRLRAMLSVPYFERAVYDLPEEAVTPDRLLKIAEETELKIQGGPATRPIMSVPHILEDESCCSYQGYILAEMSVQQTRAHFLSKYGRLVDEPRIGADLTEHYWKAGNSAPFLDLVQQLTGKPLSADAWVESLQEPLDIRLAHEKADYDAAVKAGPKFERGTSVDLGVLLRFLHGDEVIADSAADGGLAAACRKFKEWIPKAFPSDSKL
eukprot:TRINITY_DN538_c0_g2_i1.p1 TRINITY_DN538_c0_g2~~TRINITY_DN538_c0_g2_i1.p1  ORF type:complete len:649 (+),score=207.80 TRINITY_DN538_c0_g2_i1:75-1949(+)